MRRRGAGAVRRPLADVVWAARWWVYAMTGHTSSLLKHASTSIVPLGAKACIIVDTCRCP